MLGVFACLLVRFSRKEGLERSGIKFKVGEIYQFSSRNDYIFTCIYSISPQGSLDPPMEGFEPV